VLHSAFSTPFKEHVSDRPLNAHACTDTEKAVQLYMQMLREVVAEIASRPETEVEEEIARYGEE